MIADSHGIIAHEIHQPYLHIALIHGEIRRSLREITAVEEQEVGSLPALEVEESHAAHETSASSLGGVAEIRAVWENLRVGIVGVIHGDGLVLFRLGDGEDGNHDKEYGGNLFHVLSLAVGNVLVIIVPYRRVGQVPDAESCSRFIRSL